MAITTQVLNSDGQVTMGIPQTTSFVNNSFSTDPMGGINFPIQNGVPMQSMYLFKVIPAVGTVTSIAQTQTYTANGYVTLNTTNTASATAGYIPICSNAVSYFGQVINIPLNPTFNGSNTCIKLDCERSIAINYGTATANSAVSWTISGWDYRGTAISETFVINQTAGTGSTTYSSKCYSIIGYIYCSAATSAPVSIGTNFVSGKTGQRVPAIGLPYYLANDNDVLSCQFGATGITGTAIIPGNIWRYAINGVQQVIPSASSPSARGKIQLPASPDGTTWLATYYFVYGADSETAANIQNLYPTTLGQYLFSQNQSKTDIAFPYITPNDLVGMAYPGDMAANTLYQKALAT